MPHRQALIDRLSGAVIFSLLNFIHGYWKFLLQPSSQEGMYFHRPFWCLHTRRVARGATNSLSCFQSSMKYLFSNLLLLTWLGNLFGLAQWPKVLLDILRQTSAV